MLRPRVEFQINSLAEKFAACANILPAVESIYRWKEKIENAGEVIVFFKTTPGSTNSFSGKIAITSPLRRAGNNLYSGRKRVAGIPALGRRELRLDAGRRFLPTR